MEKEIHNFKNIRIEVTIEKIGEHNSYRAYLYFPIITRLTMTGDNKIIREHSTPDNQLYHRELVYKSRFRRPSLRVLLQKYGYGSLYEEGK